MSPESTMMNECAGEPELDENEPRLGLEGAIPRRDASLEYSSIGFTALDLLMQLMRFTGQSRSKNLDMGGRLWMKGLDLVFVPDSFISIHWFAYGSMEAFLFHLAASIFALTA